MNRHLPVILVLFLQCTLAAGAAETPEPPEPWLAERLAWFSDMKFGFFMHFGAYSQWGCIESWPLVEVDKWARPDDLPAWTERGKDMQRFIHDYWLLPKTFNPVKFDPSKMAAIAKDAGMKYVVFTTKHHDGFSMYDTKLTDYRITAPDCPFHTNSRANVTKEIFDTFRKEGFAIGAYYSKADWHHPGYWSPDAPAKTRNPNYDTLKEPEKWAGFVKFVHGQIEELMTGYGPVDILWLDAGQVRPPTQDIQMDKLAAMARSHQPKLIIVDRTVGGKYENYRTPEQEVPDKPLAYTWESCLTMGDSWSFKPNDKYKSTHKLIHLLVDIVAKGGNFLLNVGPQPDGELPPVAVERMREIGKWMKINSEAIYGTRPIAPYKSGPVAFTSKGNTVYAIYLTPDEKSGLPESIEFRGPKPAANTEIRLLGSDARLTATVSAAGLVHVSIPQAIRQNPPCENAFVLKYDTEP